MIFFRKILYGLIIGIAAVTPGVSGGVLAAAMGLYEPIIKALNGLTRDFKRNFMFLLPLGIGGAAGLFAFSLVMSHLVALAPHAVMFLFFGLVAGSIPSVVREANEQGFRPVYLLGTVAGLFIVMSVSYFDGVAGMGAASEWTFFHGLICGAVLAVGTVVPGISTSFILMYLGMYSQMLTAIADIQILRLLPIGAGFVLAAYPLVRLTGFFFSRYRGMAYYTVLGFLLGSMAAIFPGLRTGWPLALDALLFVAGTAGSLLFLRAGKVHKDTEAENGTT